ncbi:YHS domain-containing protein [Streptomyces indicus]|uniref:YHS domain-containing protein n=1 Tax=Streptomyces indicus TaxID=417292 RepID=UPI001C40A0BD|nr:YHS domain-containing protein [Streptomyces indicus]
MLGEQERVHMGRRIIDALMTEDDSHAVEVLDAQRLLTHVLVHETASWITGERPAADPADPPRFLVRVTVPASWRKEASSYFIRTITEVLAATEQQAGRDGARLFQAPHAIVLVNGISEGGVGLHGQAMGSLELTELISRPYRDRHDAETHASAPGRDAGLLIDPVCGMSVRLEDSPLTLVHEGKLYAFCHGMCRRSFADEHGVPLAGP